MATTKALRKLETNSGLETTRSATPTREDIAQRAYALYEARGREDGHDLDDWLQAERELLEEESSK
jgi:outer membrane protein TolC